MVSSLPLIFLNNYASLDITDQKQVFMEFYNLVYPVALFVVKDHSTAEDILQDSFLLALSKSNKLDNKACLHGWLKKITQNTAISYLRKYGKRQNVHIINQDNHNFENTYNPVYKEVEFNLLEQSLMENIQQLKPKYRYPFLLKVVQGYSYKEIAGILNSNENAIKTNVFRTREFVKSIYEKEWKTN